MLLLLSFPNYNLWPLAWVGFVPLFIVIRGKSRTKAFLFSYITGIIFWFGTIYWLAHVTFIGLVILVLYLALYFGIFGLAIRTYQPRATNYELLFIPSFWVLLEYIRGWLFTGFPWALLGYSQYLNLPAIQIADITGVWGVSFLVMLVNVAIVEIIWSAKNKLGPRLRIVTILLVLILSLVLSYGYYRLSPQSAACNRHPVKISVIQGNIPQDLKWEPAAREEIIEKYLRLTREALKDKPDLIIWPEAAIPAVIEDSPEYFKEIRDFTGEMRTPLLLGAVRNRGEFYYNNAILLSKDGELAGEYSKLHLVPFGEYIPLRKALPFLETVVPIGDFSPGKEYVVFANDTVRFSVLICFEDLFPELSRRFVNQGADFLVNITNDAWFAKSSSPYQHFSASVFRAVENRVPLVRAANTGVSGFIAPSGRIIYATGIFVDDARTEELGFYSKKRTLYSRLGDVFVFICLLFVSYGIIPFRKNQPAAK